MEKINNFVSIILPTYNGEKYVKRAIESVIAQTYQQWELIIIDDGSTDGTHTIVEQWSVEDARIRYFKNDTNLGIQKTLNRGLHEARGEYIARIDDDDTWCEASKLQQQVDFLNDNKEYVLVGTGVIIIDEKEKELIRYLLPTKDHTIRNSILAKNCFVHSSVVFRKDKALEVGEYDESNDTRHIEDYDLWLKLGVVGKLLNLPTYAVKFTQRDNSISAVSKIEQFKKNIKLIKKYKNKYPNYLGAIIKSYIRLFFYGFIKILPIKYFNIIQFFYKKNW